MEIFNFKTLYKFTCFKAPMQQKFAVSCGFFTIPYTFTRLVILPEPELTNLF